ncbi:hypothetical protein BpHYR1_043797, partial [Brachionus plicatilis]
QPIQSNLTDTNLVKSTFDILYIVPEKSDTVLSLNQKHTIGGGYDQGWILPQGELITLNLYMYYDGIDESKVMQFSYENQDSNSNQASPSLYLFFTNELNCDDYMSRNYWQLEIVERIAMNTYRAQLKNIRLPYSSKPLHICLQQFDSDDDIHDQLRFYSHQGNDYWTSIVTTKDFMPSWARVILFIVL